MSSDTTEVQTTSQGMKRRRSSRVNAGKRKLTYFEEFADDILAVYLDGEDVEEIRQVLKTDVLHDAKVNEKDKDYVPNDSDSDSDSESDVDQKECTDTNLPSPD